MGNRGGQSPSSKATSVLGICYADVINLAGSCHKIRALVTHFCIDDFSMTRPQWTECLEAEGSGVVWYSLLY